MECSKLTKFLVNHPEFGQIWKFLASLLLFLGLFRVWFQHLALGVKSWLLSRLALALGVQSWMLRCLALALGVKSWLLSRLALARRRSLAAFVSGTR